MRMAYPNRSHFVNRGKQKEIDMSDTQGRGAYYDESRIERAAKRARENGGDDSDIRRAADDEFGEASSELIRQIRDRIRRNFS